jgi:hypothetical protein
VKEFSLVDVMIVLNNIGNRHCHFEGDVYPYLEGKGSLTIRFYLLRDAKSFVEDIRIKYGVELSVTKSSFHGSWRVGRYKKCYLVKLP